MTQNSLLDTLLSLLGGFAQPWLAAMIPNLLFRLAGLWLAIAGWRRHRAPGFLLLLVSSVIGLVSVAMLMAVYAKGPNVSPLASIASQIGYIAAIFGTAGIWHFVYRARFAPPEESQP